MHLFTDVVHAEQLYCVKRLVIEHEISQASQIQTRILQMMEGKALVLEAIFSKVTGVNFAILFNF